MKKLLAVLCAGVLAAGVVGCGSNTDNMESQGTVESSASLEESTQESPEADGSEAESSAWADASGEGNDDSEGWTEEMESIKAAVVDALGDNYWPNMALDAEMFETSFGVTADMYEDYLAEMPMISTNVDTLVVVKAKEGQEQAVEDALNAYRNAKVNDTMQYPMNLGKIQASRVDRIGSYVCFVQLGADTMEALDQGDEAVIAQCQEVNELVLEIISQKIQ